MKARILRVKESNWTPEELHQVNQLHGDPQKENLCLPNIFRSKKMKSPAKEQTFPSYKVHHTARELLLEVLDKEAVLELLRRSGPRRPSLSSHLSEEDYSEALAWFSVVLQSGLSLGEDGSGSEQTQNLDRVLKRNGFQTRLLSLTQLDDEDKLEALSAFCSHVCRRYRTLHRPGPGLAVKKYTLAHQDGLCSVQLVLLCDPSSGFICNMFVYRPEQLQKQRRPAVEQVVKHLLGPFCSQNLVVQLDGSVCRVQTDLFGPGLHIHLDPVLTGEATGPSSSSSSSVPLNQDHPTSEDSELSAHLQGWTGPALVLLSDLKGPGSDPFLPGLWATLHMICINTYVLHSLQSRGSGRRVRLAEFTRTLVSQLPVDPASTTGTSVPVLPRLNSCSFQETGLPNLFKPRSNTKSWNQPTDDVRTSSRSGSRTRSSWNRPGVCGLDNLGNSCYLNAVLQCLSSTVPLVEHLLNPDTRRELTKCKCRVAEVFLRLLEKMWLGSSSICAAAEARSVLSSVLPQFNNYCQQDAQELLLHLLDLLHQDLREVARRQMNSNMKHQARKEQNRTWSIESTMVSLLFEGQLRYTTLCLRCERQAQNLQSFTVLSLPIPTDTTRCSIQDCLSLFFEETVLTGAEQMFCSECGLRRETAVFTCLDKPPEILMLHLKRFGCRGKNQVKLRTNVLFSLKLDLSRFLTRSEQNASSYQLYAVVNHVGHLNMGHYTAVCYNGPARTWFCFDDAEVREVQDSLVPSPNAYLLLYSRRPFQKPKILGL
ncbi:uncharacterized protein LOC112449962 [Kryptolebias marmoratus]|uniref:uncharacterized protein LOC112449962 n=1 Tax=Kryptolebias marmoratus TaxID=37003 RepID=UPI000D52FA5F|nr:uncharacterized protein LOC112449962 [Kryptolebias marmoratus]